MSKVRTRCKVRTRSKVKTRCKVRTIKKRLNTRRKTRNNKHLRRRRYLSKKRGGAWWNRTNKKNDTNEIINFGKNEPTSSYRRERNEERDELVNNYNREKNLNDFKKNWIDNWKSEEWARRYDEGSGYAPTEEEGKTAWEELYK
jgi:hypothetical protein